MASNKGGFWEVLFAPLDFLGVPMYPSKIHKDGWSTNLPNFNGNPLLALIYLASFMD